MASENLLRHETSPYLLQHRDNPVHWMAWGPEAFARARAENKAVLLSIGYAACHWCHVMAHESFEDDEVAGVMNQRFVNVKVDREERPDIDRIYMTALQAMGEQGGWPLTIFLDADGAPFWGGTYFPKTPRYGRPGFLQILDHIANVYENEPDKIGHNTAAVTAALAAHNAPSEAEGEITMALIDQTAARILSLIDFAHGGIRGAPKFPQSAMLELLWRRWRRHRESHGESGGGSGEDNARYRDAVTISLAHMCQGGIYDHLAGGFARYSVDERWLIPHFEKMLYDNAQLVSLMVLVWQETGDELLRVRIAETCGWVLDEMVADGGGFAASLDADAEGEEGRFTVWTAQEIAEVLGPDDAQVFAQSYDVTAAGNFEGKTNLNRLARLELYPADEEARLEEMRAKLLARRATRVRPGWDDKVLSDWNGLMIQALARAGFVFDTAGWRAAAVTAFAFVRDTMWVDGRLMHSARAGKLRHLAVADGYANMIGAALALYQSEGEAHYLETAQSWWDEMDAQFWDREHGGYTHAAADVPNLIVRTRTSDDDATPNANATMIAHSAALYGFTGEARYEARAQAIIDAFKGAVAGQPFSSATFLNGAEDLMAPVDAVIAGRAGDQATDRLIDAVRHAGVPGLRLMIVGEGQDLPAAHPAAGKGRVDGLPALYLCRGRTCSAPVTTKEEAAGLFAPAAS